MELGTTKPLDVYRGQASSGQGEGPDRAIAHGEQYLRVAKELYKPAILDAIRPWMTLDSDPADHQRLNDQLEGWSLFTAGDYLFVVRLVSAGIYDRRAAYFAHGRAWDRKILLQAGSDPGLYLATSDAFDDPWTNGTAQRQPAVPEALPRWSEAVQSAPDRAARFLGHLLQSMVENQPLVIAVPVAAFASRGMLHGLVSFARGGLPANLRNACSIRIYSRMPEVFLRHLAVNLIVIPEETVSNAVAARPGVTLLNADGERVAGKDLDSRALDYANAVVERAVALPEGLPYFAERFEHFARGGLPAADEVRSIQVVYNIAFALAGPLDRRAELLRKYLPRAAVRLGPGAEWNRLIRDEDWQQFPREAVEDQLLADPRDLSESGSAFLQAVERAAAQLRVHIDERLTDWWDPDQHWKLRRLLELLAHDPPLISEDAAADRTADIPLDRLADAGPVAGILRAESRRGSLSRRAPESADLAAQARDPRVFDILSSAVAAEALDPGWGRIYVRNATNEEVVDAAGRWLKDSQFWTRWGAVPKQLLDRLRALTPPPPSLVPFVKRGFELDPAENLDLYLRSADVLARIDEADGRAPEVTRLSRLWQALPRLSENRKQFLEAALLEPEWRCLQFGMLDLSSLLTLATTFQKDESFDRLYTELDERMYGSAEATTDALVRSGWWLFWRTRSRSARDVLAKSAFAWMVSDAWTSEGVEPTLEAWEKVVGDLPRKISGRQMSGLRGEGPGRRRPWPWIPPFEEDQLDALIDRAEDLGALAEIADAVRLDASAPALTSPAHEWVLERSDHATALPSSGLGWLYADRSGIQPQTLSIAQSTYLHDHAGHLTNRAITARIGTLAQTLERDPLDALKAAGTPDLWTHERFLSTIGNWMNRKGSCDAIGERNVQWIDAHANGEPRPPVPSPERRLVDELVSRDYHNAARLIDAARQKELQEQNLVDHVFRALLNGQATHPAWQHFEKQMKQVHSGRDSARHPLLVLADRIRRGDGLRPEELHYLAVKGWHTFEKAAYAHPFLIRPTYAAFDFPALHFAASMLPAGAVGSAARLLISTDLTRDDRNEPQWWQCLLRSIHRFSRYPELASADDREEVILALLWRAIEQPAERRAFGRALDSERKYDPKWDLLSELRKGRP